LVTVVVLVTTVVRYFPALTPLETRTVVVTGTTLVTKTVLVIVVTFLLGKAGLVPFTGRLGLPLGSLVEFFWAFDIAEVVILATEEDDTDAEAKDETEEEPCFSGRF
jgi:hypothetical protein